jgi:hypothetical protein
MTWIAVERGRAGESQDPFSNASNVNRGSGLRQNDDPKRITDSAHER